LSVLGYEAYWEARHHGPEVTLRRCPFAALREEFPELCAFDQGLLERALGRPVEVLQTAVNTPPGALAVCRFRVRLA